MATKENFRDRVRRHSLAWVMSDKTRVRILGGGFGGLYAPLEFEKRNDRASKSRSFGIPARHAWTSRNNFRIQLKKRFASLPEEPIGAHTP